MTEKVDEIKEKIKRICDEDSSCDEKLFTPLDEALGFMHGLLTDSLCGIQKTDAVDLEAAGVKLWNHTVAMKTKRSLSALANAKCRYLAYMMVSYANQGSAVEETLKKQVVMGMKTGRALIDADKLEDAERVLNMTNMRVQQLHSVVIERQNVTDPSNSGLDQEKVEVERDMFKLLCCRAEVAVCQGKNSEAVSLIHMAKQFLARFPKEGSFLSMLCYNFGVDLYQRQRYEEAVAWLRESYEMGKDRKGIIPKNQARTLRLLANAYIESDPVNSLDKALNAVSLANTEHYHPAGLYLKLRILLMVDENQSSVVRVLEDIIHHTDCTLELGLGVIQLLKQHNRFETSLDFPTKLLKRFEQSPDAGQVLVSQLQAVLQFGCLSDAKEFAEKCITAHNTGKPLDANTRKQFHLIFWEQAAAAYELRQFGEALMWYNYSMSLSSPSEMVTSNMAKLQRNRASCFLNQGQITQAKEAIENAEKCDSDQAHTHFIIFKISIAENDCGKASQSLQKMVSEAREVPNLCQSQTYGLICLAAQIALEQDKTNTACVALDFLICHSGNHQQVFTALRCLIRLRLAEADGQQYNRESLDGLLPLVQTAYNKLLILREEKEPGLSVTDEATWFMKIAWNIALKCENYCFLLKGYFSLCLKLLCLLPADDALVCKQKTCTLMAAAGCLQLSKTLTDGKSKTEALEETLYHIQEFKTLQTARWIHPDGASAFDTSDVLLLLYEFEARVKLQDDAAESVLERALTLPQPEPKTFEALAALAVDPPAYNKSLSIRSLKVAIRTHLQRENPDFNQCSKDIHTLIELAMSLEQGSNKQEAFNYFKETIDVIDKRAKGLYPEIEILWLMVKAWNCGVRMYSYSDYEESEKWCSMSMGLLQYLTSMKSSYEDQMNSVYGEILSNIEHARGKATLEE